MKSSTTHNTYDIFIGSGAVAYPWYGSAEFPEGSEADWSLSFTDPDDHEHTVTRRDIMRAARRIASQEGADIPFLSLRVHRECQALIFKGADDVDFDADMADQVIQVAAFGKVVYG